jgi:hypothetical protein
MDVTIIAGRVAGRQIHGVADAAYHGKGLRDLPAQLTWTTRLPRNAGALPPGPSTYRQAGTTTVEGDRIGTPLQAAAHAAWQAVQVGRYGRVETVQVAVIDCLWYGVFGPLPVRMLLVRDRDTGPMLALVTTDLVITPADLVARYAARWAIEVTFFDTRQTLGVAQARNRTEQAVARTWAFGMYVYPPGRARVRHPWPPVRDRGRASGAGTVVSVEDRTVLHRHAHRGATRHQRRAFMGSRPAQPTNAEIRQVQHAWALAAV